MRSDGRSAGLLLALVLHAGLLGGLAWRWRAPLAPATPEHPPLMLRWLSPPPASAERPVPAARPAQPGPSERRSSTREAIHAPPVKAADRAAPEPAASPPDPAPTALNLALPADAASAPPSLRGRALNDPRVQPRPGYSERFAATLGTDTTLHEDALPNGGRRFRQGTACVETRESLSAQTDPFGGSKPKIARSCN